MKERATLHDLTRKPTNIRNNHIKNNAQGDGASSEKSHEPEREIDRLPGCTGQRRVIPSQKLEEEPVFQGQFLRKG